MTIYTMQTCNCLGMSGQNHEVSLHKKIKFLFIQYACLTRVSVCVTSCYSSRFFPWFPKTKKHDLVSAPCVYLARYRCSNLLWNSDYSFQQLFVALSTRSIIFVTQKIDNWGANFIYSCSALLTFEIDCF